MAQDSYIGEVEVLECGRQEELGRGLVSLAVELSKSSGAFYFAQDGGVFFVLSRQDRLEELVSC